MRRVEEMCSLIPRSAFSLLAEGVFFEVIHRIKPRSKGALWQRGK